jgi:rubrerythrin
MIFPLIEQEKEHIKRLDELLHAGNLDSLFRIQKPFHIKKEDLNNTTVFEVNMRHLSFLSYGILEKEILIKLYSRLMSLTSNQDVGFLFKRLADDEKKQKSILTNHYELEMLSQEG